MLNYDLFCREFSTALETLDQALGHASGCVRLKMARGDCLAHLGRYELLLLPGSGMASVFNFRYVDGAKAASSILQQDQRHVGALFLRYGRSSHFRFTCLTTFTPSGASACTTRTMLRELSPISSRFMPTHLDFLLIQPILGSTAVERT